MSHVASRAFRKWLHTENTRVWLGTVVPWYEIYLDDFLGTSKAMRVRSQYWLSLTIDDLLVLRLMSEYFFFFFYGKSKFLLLQWLLIQSTFWCQTGNNAPHTFWCVVDYVHVLNWLEVTVWLEAEGWQECGNGLAKIGCCCCSCMWIPKTRRRRIKNKVIWMHFSGGTMSRDPSF